MALIVAASGSRLVPATPVRPREALRCLRRGCCHGEAPQQAADLRHRQGQEVHTQLSDLPHGTSPPFLPGSPGSPALALARARKTLR